MLKRTWWAILVASLVVSIAPAASSETPPDPNAPPTEVSVDQKQVGAVLERGELSANGQACTFEGDRIFSTEKTGEEHWQVFEITDDCELVLAQRWIGTIADAPPGLEEVVERIIEAESNSEEPSQERAPKLKTAGFVFGGEFLAAETCQEHKQKLYTNGYGGPTDQLTKLYSGAGICTNGSTAEIEWHSRSCYATNPPGSWTWVVDSCTTTSIKYGPASYVYKTDLGAFHCSPPGSFPCNLSSPDGYYHTMYARIRAWGSGTVTCDWWWGGQTVLGPYRQILLGC